MKKKKTAEPKPKEFSSRALAAVLKGVHIEAAPAPVKPSVKPIPAPVQDEAGLFLRTVSGVRKLNGEKIPEHPPEDPGLFTGAMGDVRRLHSGEGESHKKKHPALDEREKAFFLKAVNELHLDVTFQDHLPESADSASPLAVNRLRQLRRGAVRLEMELDLHGLAKDEALKCMATFIESAVKRGFGAVLIITGKGNHSQGEPVLQRAVIGWLREQGKGAVAEFAPAPREHGGNGALVVFLKKAEK